MSQEIIEGIAALTAVVVLFWVSNWMVSKSESAAWTSYIESKVSSGSSRGSSFALAFTAWLAVFREGAEVILFYQPMLKEDRPDMCSRARRASSPSQRRGRLLPKRSTRSTPPKGRS